MSDDNLEERVRGFVVEELCVDPSRVTSGTDLVDDLRIYGDDVWDLVEKFGKEFQVDVSAFRWYHHTGPEGCNPFWLLFKPWWARCTHVPIRLEDLVESARRHEWTVLYADS